VSLEDSPRVVAKGYQFRITAIIVSDLNREQGSVQEWNFGERHQWLIVRRELIDVTRLSPRAEHSNENEVG
jgi:hypothetical protein